MESAVLVRNACKSYGKKSVLDNLFMNVQAGTIYGLLGASGCGKTTLLSCIVGQRALNSGTIWTLGGEPGTEGSGVPGSKVGYMPQDIALVGEFTVKDAVYYFGRIFNMKEDQIEERFGKLAKLLDLPPENRFLKNCSGGQQRRVSFAAAMVHMPKLLILDEPTVGVDPVLRERIWDHLVELTAKGEMSVIVTTHYIEEARQAHTIGLMRNGKLLAESSPAQLLAQFHTNSLEEVFLSLSRKQEDNAVNEVELQLTQQRGGVESVGNSQFDVSTNSLNTVTNKSTDMLTQTTRKKKPQGGAFSLNVRHLKALMDKNWKQFYRNISGIVFILMFPVLETLAFFLAVGTDVKDVNLAIVNDESMSTLCPDFSPNGTAIPYSFTSCHFSNLSCRFLEYLEDPMIHKVKYDTRPDAMEDVKRGKVVGVLYMAQNFTDSFEERVEDLRNVEENVLNFSEIKVWLDMSNRQVGATIKYKLLNLYLDFQNDLFQDCNYDEKLSKPWTLTTFYGDRDESFTIFMVPGILLTVMFFMGAIMTSQIIITDRLEGVWDRTTIAGVSSLEITLTHFLLQAAVVVVHTIEVLSIAFIFFKIDYIGNIWLIILLTYIQGLAGMSYGFLISVVSYNHSMANIVATGSFYPMILICGLMWPLEGMPIVLQWISKCLPFTTAINSFRNIMKKGWNIDNIQVYNGFAISITWIIGLMILSVYLIKIKR